MGHESSYDLSISIFVSCLYSFGPSRSWSKGYRYSEVSLVYNSSQRRIQGGQIRPWPHHRSCQWSLAPLETRKSNDSTVNLLKSKHFFYTSYWLFERAVASLVYKPRKTV